MLSSKRTSFFSNLLSNSQADDLNDAAREWKMSKIGHSEQFSPCECCGTAMKRHAIIENEVTGATLIIGLNCLENLRCTQEWLELPSLKEYVAMGKAILKGKIKQFYEENTPVVFRNWRNWFLSLEDIPDDLKEGVAQLRYWGILSDEFVGRFIKYHDDNRLFPREVLIPDNIYYHLKITFAIPDYLTINQAKGYLEYRKVEDRGYKVCPKCLMICEPAHFPNHLIQEHNYQICPVCNDVYESTILDKHLRGIHNYRECSICYELCDVKTHLQEKHDSELCPHCNFVIKSDEFDNHLQQKHNYEMCPLCKQLVKDFKFHIERKHKLNRKHKVFQLCPECKCIVKKTELNSHLQKKHGYQKCPKCMIFIAPERLNAHFINVHDCVPCPVCQMFFSSTEIENHLWHKHNNKKCPVCGKSFKSKMSLG